MKKHSHYYSETQTSIFKKQKIQAKVRNIDLELFTGPGVFSYKKIDKGTKLLVEHALIKKDWKVLDLGCGYGVVGITISKAFPDTEVVLVDINKRAVSLAKENIRLNNALNARALWSDLFSKINEQFDTILLNPPQTAGKEVCFAMITKSKTFLVKGGLLQLVARHNVGGKVLSEKMLEVFHNMQEIGKKAGYRVYVSEKQGTP